MERKLFLNEIEEHKNQENDFSTQMMEEKLFEHEKKNYMNFEFLVPRFTKSESNLDDDEHCAGLGGVALYQEYLSGLNEENKPLPDVVKDLLAVIKKKDDQINLLQAVTHK